MPVLLPLVLILFPLISPTTEANEPMVEVKVFELDDTQVVSFFCTNERPGSMLSWDLRSGSKAGTSAVLTCMPSHAWKGGALRPGGTMSRRRTPIGGSALVGLMVVVLSMATAAADRVRSSSGSAVDEKILTEMFRARVFLNEFGHPKQMEIVPGSPSMYGVTPDDPLYEYFTRWRQLYDAHEALVQEDSAYKRRFAELEGQLVAELGYYATQRDGRMRVHTLFSVGDVYQDILKKAGPTSLHDIPESAQNDRWGSCARPYAYGVASEDVETVRESVVSFHYCSGMREQDGHGITISGGQASPYVRAHNALYETNPNYQKVFDKVISTFVERARTVDPMDFAGAAAVTRDLRGALIREGVADALEEFVGLLAPEDGLVP